MRGLPKANRIGDGGSIRGESSVARQDLARVTEIPDVIRGRRPDGADPVAAGSRSGTGQS